jgi:hypothetical protein
MKYVEPSELVRVKQIDLLSYLEKRESDELVKLGNDTYTTKSHDSLKLSNDRWYWWSQGFGGKTALDYLVKVKGHSFLDAVQRLGAHEIELPKTRDSKPETRPRQTLALPLPAPNNDAAVAYLSLRGIDPHVIDHCIETGLIYAAKKGNITNVVFVGKNRNGKQAYGAIRGTASDFKGEAAGSDKRFAFRLNARTRADTVHVFEGAVDVLSYATLVLGTDENWRDLNLLSLGGIPPATTKREQTRLPQSFTQYLADNLQTKHVYLHLDNDEPGINAADMIATALTLRKYDVSVAPPPAGKDVNDYLMLRRPKPQTLETVPLRESKLQPAKKNTSSKKEKEQVR